YQRFQGSPYDERRTCINSCHTYLSTASDCEGETVASQLLRAIRIKNDVGRRVVWRRIHRIRTCKRPRCGEANIIRLETGKSDGHGFVSCQAVMLGS